MKSGELSGDAICPTAGLPRLPCCLPAAKSFVKKSVNRILSQNTPYTDYMF